MAVNTPFQCGGAVVDLPAIDRGKKVVIRCEAGTFTVVFKRNGKPSASGADGFLSGGDATELEGPGIFSFLNTVNDPKLYWYVV